MALSALLVAGCSTVPVTTDKALPVPADRVYQPEYLQASADRSSTVVVLRDKGFSGSGCSHDISVNNIKVLSIRQAEGATLHLAPGAYFLKLETGGGLCPNISTSQNLVLAAGERQVYRVLLPSDGNLRLTRQE